MNKIDGTAEAWEDGSLGCDEQYVEASDISDAVLDDALSLKLISIRLQNSLIEDLKEIAKIEGLGYQPLIKKVLLRFVDAEKRKALKEKASRARFEEEAGDNPQSACG
jgi:hypothetical protein